MNWKRGLFRLWLVLSLCWIAPMVALVWGDLGSHEITPDYTKWSAETLAKAERGETLSVSDYPPDWPGRLATGGIIIGPPIAALLLGSALLWAGRGFRRG
jgi:hypothetical protein